jgi:hypothetical protein
MRRTIVLLGTAVVLALWASPAFAQDDQNCDDLESQAAAQAHLRSDPSDPDGLDAPPGPADGNDRAGGDGIACEDNPAPYDREPVVAGPQPTEPPTTEPPTTEPPASETPPIQAPANEAPPTTVGSAALHRPQRQPAAGRHGPAGGRPGPGGGDPLPGPPRPPLARNQRAAPGLW